MRCGAEHPILRAFATCELDEPTHDGPHQQVVRIEHSVPHAHVETWTITWKFDDVELVR